MFGKKYYSNDSFTIECWFHPTISSSNEIPIVGDSVNSVGLFYKNGNIIFKIGTQSLEYTLVSINKSFYLAAVYTKNSISIYIDGELASSKTLNNFEFTNSSLSLKSGPTSSASDSFLINSVAIYRYALTTKQINYHFLIGQSLPAIQIAEPYKAEFFELYDDELSCLFKFTYPGSRKWKDLVTDGLNHNTFLDCLELIETSTATSSTIVLNEFISIPTSTTFDSSKIEWDGDNGITIQASTDGITYTACVNGQQIPGYSIGNFSTSGKLYLRITFTSSDTSKYIPRLFNLQTLFYNDQTRYSYNGSSYLVTLDPDANTSSYRITMGKLPYDILSRNTRNGLRTVTDSGFKVVTTNSISSIEFFYTPTSLNDSGILRIDSVGSYSAAAYSWRNNGTVSKTNISAIYVNGVDKSSQTNISNVFKAGQLHHIILVFASPCSGNIKFNYSLFGSSSALYQYLALYDYAMTSSQAIANYGYYIKKESSTIADSSIVSMSENDVDVYNNDWVVLQNV